MSSRQKTPKLRVDPEFHALIPPLAADEREQLEQNLIADGRCIKPLIAWKDVIIDGHNRYEICTEHGIPFTVKKMNFADRDTAKMWIILHQLGQRNLNDFQRTEVALKLKPLLEAQAEEREKSGKRNPSQNSDEGRTDEKIADAAGVSRDTVRKVAAIKDKSPKKVQEKVRSGELSINRAHQQLAQNSAGNGNGKAPELKDCRGTTIEKDRVEKAFACAALFAEAEGLHRQLLRKVDEIANSDGGAFLDLDEFKSRAKEAKDCWLLCARPYVVCPTCKGDGCKACRKTGYLPKFHFDSAVPEELKK